MCDVMASVQKTRRERDGGNAWVRTRGGGGGGCW